MAKIKRYGVNVGGLEFDLDTLGDMPENVRKYLDELGNQLAENGAEGMVKIDGDHIPAEVDAWLRAKLDEKKVLTDKEGPDTVKVGEIDREWYSDFMDKYINKHAARINSATDGRYRPQIAEMATLVSVGFAYMIEHDEHWQKLGTFEAACLFEGVAQSMITAAVGVAMEETREAGDEDE